MSNYNKLFRVGDNLTYTRIDNTPFSEASVYTTTNGPPQTLKDILKTGTYYNDAYGQRVDGKLRDNFRIFLNSGGKRKTRRSRKGKKSKRRSKRRNKKRSF